ncbi:MAG TPA: alpha-amylase family glycosyl hydrolase [Anaerolineales bacterium]|nr:alpha-amylase family glycosyl hydrolase [Anaerolineales bacterium]
MITRWTPPVPDYQSEPEEARFSSDREWMRGLALIAKNTHVWLQQLSRKHKRKIATLAEIPDEELDELAQQGMTGLWLIGLWERSRASERIKQRMGQPEAAASAYSIADYSVAAELGGWHALASLRDRARQRGIRLSADMVPNHMGIDSTWVIEHPERFLSVGQSPYPAYSFNSENLSGDERVEIHLEDHYYDRTDAAVVFLRRDRRTGRQLYVYHGNDGTAYPWNDTAQLDYSRADVREAVIQTILHVARNFPIIRFDAAMALTKKHIQRLWFLEPGASDAIPSRSEHGMNRAQFEDAMPEEFWREVVDRVAADAPDTLLLAEAFWLLEGFFVRTLGMHRVYNSSFMHMMRDEENAKYRQLLKSTLEFDPEILQRYVNFMSNPDEKTALEQFGRGDKYFGVCTLMATLPGTPLFAHGQIQGLRERYGMEFRMPRLEEQPDTDLLWGHECRIFPLLRRRSLFAGAEQFHLFDFTTQSGRTNENVLAYSNRHHGGRALVLFHNKPSKARGWVRISAAAPNQGSRRRRQNSLVEALDLPPSGFATFRDYATGLEHIRDCAELGRTGLYAELGAYQHHVFLDWKIVFGDVWGAACRKLNGAGVESLESVLDGASSGEVAARTSSGPMTGVHQPKPEEAATEAVVATRPRRRGGAKTRAKKTDSERTGARYPAAGARTAKKSKTRRDTGGKHSAPRVIRGKLGKASKRKPKTETKERSRHRGK